MHITQWGEYGVHCAVCVARAHAAGRQSIGAAEIAEAQQINIEYAQQILQRLRRGGVIESIRGPRGGYRLSRSANSISLLEILKAAEGETFAVICEHKPLSAVRCDADVPCYLRDLWFELRQNVDSFLEKYTLDELLERASPALDLPVQIGSR